MDADRKAGASGSEFTITRVFDAPRELIWKLWTDCTHLVHWWGPKGFTVRHCKMDLRPGGLFHYCLVSPDGDDMWGRFVFREVEAPERLVFIVSFSDEAGGITVHPLSPTWPREILSTVTFAGRGGKTEVTVRWQAFNATDVERKTFEEGQPSMQQGWTGTFDQLESYLAKT
jgi:uncharacterized protein YndB with AHSA1/START domain